MRNENLLVELGTEELPPKALTKLATAFADNLQKELNEAELGFSEVKWFATPRRLAVKVQGLAEKQQDKVVEKRGPAVNAAFDDQGNPTKAAQGWASANGISVADAERLKTDKGEWLLHKAAVVGAPVSELLPELVSKALAKLPIPKPMRWGSKSTQFIRPVHSLCMFYGDTLVAGSVLGLESSPTLLGHRFHGDGSTQIEHADQYEQALLDQYVMADFEKRKAKIRQDIESAANAHNAVADIDEALLDEVTSLVEWPVVMQASFDEAFLEVPKEALIYTMKDDQRYFPLLDSKGNLQAQFIFVSNIESRDPEQVVKGNERVIRPRLADARFFFETDKKQTLASRLDSLSTVLFQKQLGTLKEKSERIASLAGKIAGMLGASEQQAERAGLLSKTDLMTNMVMEFPDVQGVMGMHYARHDNEDEEVAIALDEQYKPRFSGDSLPQSGISAAVALADKLDTLVGIFGIGQVPKGDKDPFALRRAAIGVLRIIVERELPLDLETLVEQALTGFGDKLTAQDIKSQVVDFILARFRTWYQDQGVSVDVIQAVAARRPTRPADFDARIKGVAAFKSHADAEALAAANKRVANILAKNADQPVAALDTGLFNSEHESSLAVQLDQTQAQIEPALAKGDYVEVLSSLASLRSVIDAFFDHVMVMDEDLAVRANRLALLAKLRELFLQSADISLLNQ